MRRTFPKVNFMFHFGHLLVTSHSFVVGTMTTDQPEVAYVIDGADSNHLWKTCRRARYALLFVLVYNVALKKLAKKKNHRNS